MNLHRYKASISSSTADVQNYEFLGTWIGFAGLFVLIFSAVDASHVRDGVENATYTIAPIYMLYWLATQRKIFLGILALLSELIAIALGLSITPGFSELIANITCTACSLSEWERANARYTVESPLIFIYFCYFLSIFCIAFYYLWRQERVAQ